MSGTHGFVRGLSRVSTSSISEARFGRMFRWLPRETFPPDAIKMLAGEMIQFEHAHERNSNDPPPDKEHTVSQGPDVLFNSLPPMLDTPFGQAEPEDENPVIPAGYTYFGQFIDHDLTFDPNSSLQKLNDPDATEDFRTPRFDLDSLYGRGPDDQPYLYKDSAADGGGTRFLLGRRQDLTERRGELARNVEGRALIGDPRNDENGIVCQIQAIFLNFHNKVIDNLKAVRPQLNRHELFLETQRIVRWHYQYLVLNDYLKRVVGDAMWKKVFKGSLGSVPEPHVEFYLPNDGKSYMPVEFSVAAFRFGHSMIRPSYALRAGDANVGGDTTGIPFSGDEVLHRFNRIPIFSDVHKANANLAGFGPLPSGWEIDWNLFFSKSDMPTGLNQKGVRGVTPQAPGHLTQPSYRIDTKLVDPLAMLPPSVAKSGNMPDGIPSLAYRNLLRGSQFELPSGQNVANALGEHVIPDEVLWANVQAKELKDLQQNPFAFRAPLWFYILREAELPEHNDLSDALGGHHLGPVGGRIVAEVLVGIALNDHTSYLYQDRAWTPAKERLRSGFDAGQTIESIYDLIHWTTSGRMSLA